eukprot:260832-Heterocapsa_arctica.AAC.1
MVYVLQKGKDGESKKNMNVRHRVLKDLTTATTGEDLEHVDENALGRAKCRPGLEEDEEDLGDGE